jgi:transcription elongation factor Elf1
MPLPDAKAGKYRGMGGHVIPQIRKGRLGTYRCPVCCYRDMVVIAKGTTRHIVICAHCETSLDLSARGDHTLTLAVQLAEPRQPSA